MRIKLFYLSLSLILGTGVFFACQKSNEQTLAVTHNSEYKYFSKEDISSIKSWVLNQTNLKQGMLQEKDFPTLSFMPMPTTSQKEVSEKYHNGIMYINDAIITGKEADFERIRTLIEQDEALDESAKVNLYSLIQLSKQVFTTPEIIEHTRKISADPNAKENDPCGCNATYNAYVQYRIQCQAYGNVWGHCDAMNQTYQLYLACAAKTPHCPNGFIFDGANCYSGVHFPAGYQGFIWSNGFYTKRNCAISTANNCCPPGYGYDGANCHYWGKYFPSDYTPFIWNNTFYVKHKCW